jgi:hypothetical protein
VVTEKSIIRGFRKNRLCETCGEETSEIDKPHQESQTSSQKSEGSDVSDCLTNNPRCLVWRCDESKIPLCEGCLDKQLSSMKYDEWTWNDEEGTEKPAKCKCGVTFKTDTPLCPICCAKEFKWNEDMMISARLFKK